MSDEISREDHIVYGMDDATPNTIDGATRRRMKMWDQLITALQTIQEGKSHDAALSKIGVILILLLLINTITALLMSYAIFMMP